MRLYEKIDTLCRHGLYAITRGPEGCFVIVAPFRDGAGNWRRSVVAPSVTEAGKTVGALDGLPEEAWNAAEGYEVIESRFDPKVREKYQQGEKAIYRGKVVEISRGTIHATYSGRDIAGRDLWGMKHKELYPFLGERTASDVLNEMTKEDRELFQQALRSGDIQIPEIE